MAEDRDPYVEFLALASEACTDDEDHWWAEAGEDFLGDVLLELMHPITPGATPLKAVDLLAAGRRVAEGGKYV